MLCYALQFFGTFFPFNAMHFIVLGDMNLKRLFMWATMGWSAYKEFYLYATEDRNAVNSSPTGHIWVGFAAVVLENLIEVKWFDKGVVAYAQGIPFPIQVAWGVPLTLLFLRYVYLLIKSFSDARQVQAFKEKKE